MTVDVTIRSSPASLPDRQGGGVRTLMNARPLEAPMRQEPIPQPSEPMQFRAIGLIRARYVPEEHLTKGNLIAPDGTQIEAVLLGRVMSLVKKHIDLEKEHLWVVYPRTREKENVLHFQIVGIWEPETLQAVEAEPEDESVADATPQPMRPKPPTKIVNEMQDGYFSVRGEVVFQSLDPQQVVIKIKQTPRPTDVKGRSFKLLLNGNLGPRAVHQFWDLQVNRVGNELVILESSCIGPMPARKPRKPFKGAPRRGPGGPRGGGSGGGGGGGRRPFPSRDRPGTSERPSRPERPAGPSPRPIRRDPPRPQEGNAS